VLSTQKLSNQAELAKVTVDFYVDLSELFNQVYYQLNWIGLVCKLQARKGVHLKLFQSKGD
jgi:hypothetical protein